MPAPKRLPLPVSGDQIRASSTGSKDSLGPSGKAPETPPAKMFSFAPMMPFDELDSARW